jgi:3-hydroxyisobutyrate dehydrogenase-like beta-hydroxyacid dehydrogenase
MTSLVFPGDRPLGFIGLGLMGRPMAWHLHSAGARLVLHNRSRAAVDELVAAGPHVAVQSPRAVAEQVGGGLIVLMLPDAPAVQSVLDGPEGLLAGLAPEALVIDMGSSGVGPTRSWAAAVAERGGAWLDAPVSGGETGARAATLSIMVGGAPEDFARARPVLERLGSTLTHLGPVGAGQGAKLVNQIVVAVTLSALAEAFALGRAAGADLGALRRALLGGFAASKLLELHGQRMIEGNFVPGGRAVNQLKDVAAGVELARSFGLQLPVLEQNLARWRELIDRGFGNLDHSAIIKLYEPGAGEESPSGTPPPP